MPAGRLAAPGPGDEPFDDTAFPSSAPADAEPRTNPVVGCGKGQENRLAVVFRDSVSPRSHPLDFKLDEVAHWLRPPSAVHSDRAAIIFTELHPYVVSNLTHAHI